MSNLNLILLSDINHTQSGTNDEINHMSTGTEKCSGNNLWVIFNGCSNSV